MYKNYLEDIDKAFGSMIELTIKLCDINTFFLNLEGIQECLIILKKEFEKLCGITELINVPPINLIDNEGEKKTFNLSNSLLFTLRPEAPLQIYLGGHIDTVYKIDSAFQKAYRQNDELLIGPGVADMKGGLVILLYALKIFEKTPWTKNVGFKVFINTDEEIGSIGSKSLIEKYCRSCHAGFIFEPSLEDGSLVIQRKGSCNYSIIVKGKAAHAGRNIHEGKNAITALTRLIEHLQKSLEHLKDTTLNIGYIKGGQQSNIVPEKAICKLNIRSENSEEMTLFDNILYELTKKIGSDLEVSYEIYKESFRPPKPKNLSSQTLFEALKKTAKDIGIHLEGKITGGVCDGNDLSAFGITNIDTMGAIGGCLHSEKEYLRLYSLKERAKLFALFLMQIANNEVSL